MVISQFKQTHCSEYSLLLLKWGMGQKNKAMLLTASLIGRVSSSPNRDVIWLWEHWECRLRGEASVPGLHSAVGSSVTPLLLEGFPVYFWALPGLCLSFLFLFLFNSVFNHTVSPSMWMIVTICAFQAAFYFSPGKTPLSDSPKGHRWPHTLVERREKVNLALFHSWLCSPLPTNSPFQPEAYLSHIDSFVHLFGQSAV